MSIRCELVERPAQPTLSVRTRTSVADLPALMGQVYGAIMQYLGELGEYPTGPPFGAYCNMDMEDLDVAIGFPVAKSLPGRGNLQPGEIPGGKAATCIHVGPYDQIEPAYTALAQWMAENGYEATGVSYEFYISDPGEVPADELQTQVVFPLK